MRFEPINKVVMFDEDLYARVVEARAGAPTDSEYANKWLQLVGKDLVIPDLIGKQFEHKGDTYTVIRVKKEWSIGYIVNVYLEDKQGGVSRFCYDPGKSAVQELHAEAVYFKEKYKPI